MRRRGNQSEKARKRTNSHLQVASPPFWMGFIEVQPWTSGLGWLVDTVYLPVLTLAPSCCRNTGKSNSTQRSNCLGFPIVICIFTPTHVNQKLEHSYNMENHQLFQGNLPNFSCCLMTDLRCLPKRHVAAYLDPLCYLEAKLSVKTRSYKMIMWLFCSCNDKVVCVYHWVFVTLSQ